MTLYRHSKGGLYRLIGQGHHSETKEPVVIYQAEDTGELWVRPAAMWEEKIAWPDGEQRPRFIPEGTVPKEATMPDENKLQKLRDIGYSIPGLCGYCPHGNFEGAKALDGWGTCDLHRYDHKKHTKLQGGRGVSIHATGTCPQFEADPQRLARTGLGAHEEFFDGRPRAPHGS